MGILPVVAQTSYSSLLAQSSQRNILVQQGKQFYIYGKYDEAIKILKQAANEFDKYGDKLNQSMTLSNLSLAYQQKGDWEQAKKAISKSLELVQPHSSDSTEKRKLYIQALLVNNQLLLTIGEPEEALDMWQDAASKLHKAGDNKGENTSKVYQSLVLQKLGLYREAFKTLIEPMRLIQTQPVTVQAIAFRSLGNILRVVGDSEELELPLEVLSKPATGHKLDYLQQSQLFLKESLKISEGQDVAEVYLSLGNTAWAAYKRAQDAYDRSPNEEDKNTAESQSQCAVENYSQVIRLNATPLDKKIQAQLNQLSLLLDYEKWVQRSKEADIQSQASQAELIPSIEWAKPLLEAQINNDNLHQLLSQIKSLSPSRTTVYARINLAKTLMNVSVMSKQYSISYPIIAKEKEKILSRFQEIEDMLKKAIEQAQNLQDKRAESYAWGYLGHLYEINKCLQDAQNTTKTALLLVEGLAEERKEAKDIAYQWQWQLGRVLTEQGKVNKNQKQQKIQQAISAYEEAVKSLESVRSDLTSFNNPELQFSFRDSVEPVYRELVDLLLPYEEKPESRQLSSEGNLQQVKEAQEALLKVQKNIEDLQVAELENFLRCRLSKTKLVPIYKTIDDQKLNVAVIYTIILDDRFEVILKLPQQKQLIRTIPTIIKKNQVEKDIKKLREDIERGKQGKNEEAQFKNVYNLILAQAESYLQNSNNIKVETLVFVLDGALRNIPIAALYDGKKYVIEKYGIAFNLGIELTEQKPLQKGKFKVLAAGTKKFLDKEVDELKYVNNELDQIKSTLRGRVKDIREDKFTTKALQQEIKSRSFDIVHLATHGQFSSSPDKTFIRAYEQPFNVKEMNQLFRSREETKPDTINLLVLSGCQTAIGDKRAAMGIAGVSVRVGASTTVASLFEVNDQYTSVLMRKFYEQLDKPNVTKAEALKLSQEALLKQDDFESPKPKYWAPFVLVGNWH